MSWVYSEVKPIEYPQPDGKISFDLLTSVALTGVNHAEGQPSHLRLPDEQGARARHTEKNVAGGYNCFKPRDSQLMKIEYAGLLGRVCPAGVYEYADAEGSDADAEGKKFVINSQVRPAFLSPMGLELIVLVRTVSMCVWEKVYTQTQLIRNSAKRVRSKRPHKILRGVVSPSDLVVKCVLTIFQYQKEVVDQSTVCSFRLLASLRLILSAIT